MKKQQKNDKNALFGIPLQKQRQRQREKKETNLQTDSYVESV